MSKNAYQAKISWYRALYLVFAVIFIYVAISQISSLKGSLEQLKSSNPIDDLLVAIAVGATYCFAALTYWLIAIKKLHYPRTLVMEFGINSLNRLLPAGIGAIGANYVYLTKSGHSRLQSAGVVAINNSLGVIGNSLVLGVLLITVRSNNLKISQTKIGLVGLIIIVLAVTSAMVYWLPNVRTKFNRGARHFFKQLMTYKDHKSKLVFGLASSIGLTLSNVVALLFSLQAVNSHLALSSVMLAFSFAIWLGAVIPVPGGVGSVEAGLVGALVAFNLALPQAVAAVLIFRLISFWLPLILGMPALVWVRRRGYI